VWLTKAACSKPAGLAWCLADHVPCSPVCGAVPPPTYLSLTPDTAVVSLRQSIKLPRTATRSSAMVRLLHLSAGLSLVLAALTAPCCGASPTPGIGAKDDQPYYTSQASQDVTVTKKGPIDVSQYDTSGANRRRALRGSVSG
jgi:hypothetical protein